MSQALEFNMPMLSWNSPSPCLSLLSASMAHMYHYKSWNIFLFFSFCFTSKACAVTLTWTF